MTGPEVSTTSEFGVLGVRDTELRAKHIDAINRFRGV